MTIHHAIKSEIDIIWNLGKIAFGECIKYKILQISIVKILDLLFYKFQNMFWYFNFKFKAKKIGNAIDLIVS